MSPSGDWVAFRTSPATGTANINKVSLRGGPAILLVTKVTGTGLSWGADDAIYAGSDRGLFRVPANGGTVPQISVTDKAKHEAGQFMPLALPDGKTVLAWSRIPPLGDQPGVENLAMVDVASGKVTTLDGDAQNPIGYVAGYLLFGRSDGTLGVVPFDPARTRSVRNVIPVLEAPLSRTGGGMAASLSAAGDLVYVRANNLSRLTLLDAQGRVISVSADEREFNSPSISPDGRRIVVVESTDNSRHTNLWLYTIDSGVLQRLTSGGNASKPGWTPDGRRVVYTLKPDIGPAEVWWIPADGSGPGERLVAMPMQVMKTVLSPDSRYAVVGTSDPKTNYDLYLVDHSGDRFVKVHLAVGATVDVTQREVLFSGTYAPDFDLSTSGTIVALRPGSADAEVIVVTNWIAELKAKVGKK